MRSFSNYHWGAIISNLTYSFLAPFCLALPGNWVRKTFLRMYGAKIGRYVYIARKTDVKCPSRLVVQSHTIVNKHCLLDARGGLTVGCNVDIAQDTSIWSAQHDYNDDYHKYISAPVVISDYVWLASRVTILPGVTMGKGSVAASGAVVTKDVDERVVVGGVPAKKIADRHSGLLYTLKKDSRRY